jgi:hypothetical protein
VYVFFHILLFRFLNIESVLKSIIIAYAIGLILLFLVGGFLFKYDFLSIHDLMGYFICNFFYYSVIAFCYFCLVNLTDTSVRIRILQELQKKANTGLSQSQILKIYNTDNIIGIRLEKLVSSGQIVKKENRYYHNKDRLVLVAYFFECLKFILIPKDQR